MFCLPERRRTRAAEICSLQLTLGLLPKPRRTAAADLAEGLIAPENFAQAYGPLAGDTILAFTANGEAHWFRLRQRDGA